MAPKASDKTADFYDQPGLVGTKRTYQLGSEEHLYPKKIVDLYKSISVGLGSKLHCWHHLDVDGRFAYLDGDNPTLEKISELTCFSVDTDDTELIQFKFEDKTGGKPKDYSLTLDLHTMGKKILYSDDGPDFKLAGKIKASDGSVVTAVSIRNMHTGVYLAVGSIYFKWNADKKEVDIDSEKGWPKQLAHERKGPTKFLITLISDKPSE